jgi:hypothetical protein
VTTIHTSADYRSRIIDRLKKDLQTARNYLKTCREYITQATREKDDETAYFWANQQDTALQQVKAIRHQLKAY